MSSEKSRLLKKIKGSTHILHPESTLVFKSAKDRIVIGRYENDTIIELDNKTVKLCEKWNYKYDTSLSVKSNSDEEESKDDDEEESKDDDEEESKDEDDDAEDNGDTEEVTEEVTEEEVVNEHINHITQKSKESSKDGSLEFSKNSNLSLDNFIRFTNGFNTLYDQMKKDVLNIEDNYITSLSTLRNELDTKTKECENITDQYNKLKQKFEGIKSLFNV